MRTALRLAAIAVFIVGGVAVWVVEERWAYSVNLGAMAVGVGLSIAADVIRPGS